MTIPMVCWALPRDLNALVNLSRRQPWLRVYFKMPKNGDFRPADTNGVMEGWTSPEIAKVVRDFGFPGVLATIAVHEDGPHNGHGYHRGRHPYLSPAAVDRYSRELFGWLASERVPLLGAQLGNELDYAPEEHNNWDEYLDRCLVATSEVEHNLPEGAQLVMGGYMGKPSHQGRPTLAQVAIDRDLFWHAWYAVHGNTLAIGDVTRQLDWLSDHARASAVTEDRAPGNHSDAATRGAAFRLHDAKLVCEFAVRDVNAFGDNPSCRWGSNNNLRRTGAMWNCNQEFDQRSWDEFTTMCLNFGIDFDPALDLPMGDTQPPPPGHVPDIDQAWNGFKVAWLKLHASDQVAAREHFDKFVLHLGRHYGSD